MKIVIVGGGTAGWLAACYLAKFNHSSDSLNEITVIESSKIPIIGAGEGSTGIFTKIMRNQFASWGMSEKEFLYETESTLKLGINFKDWNGIGTQFYSPIQPSETNMAGIDVDLLVSYAFGNYYDSSTSGYLMANGYSTYSNYGKTINGYAYHFDAHKVGKYFKKYAQKNGVKVIDTEVESLQRNSLTGELESVQTTIGKIEADMWIDCSGFSRVLIGPMGGGWKSYAEYLKVNAAIPFMENFKEGEVPNLETLSHAMPNGWMWKIPTQERYGCGYVYSDNHTTYDKAVDELIQTLGREVEPLRNIKFDCGRVETPWVNNVIAIGLSQGFVEPLEATSIHATIIQLDFLLSNSLNFVSNKADIVFDSNIKRYNTFANKLFDDIKDLIQIHYMTEREDTEFWKNYKYEVSKTEKVQHILDVCKHRSPSMLDFDLYHGSANWGVWCWTLIGLGILTKETAQKTLMAYRNTDDNVKNAMKSIQHRNWSNSISLMKNEEFYKKLINKNL
jgi:tryptophan halogenase